MPQNKKASVIDLEVLISLMTVAYKKGLRAGQQYAIMKDTPEFVEEAVRLFASGLTDSLAHDLGNSAH